MTIPGNATALLLPSINTQYKVERSLRFNSSDSAYCSFLPSTSGNRKKWTLSIWVKRSKLGASQAILHLYNYPTPAYYDTSFAFNSSDQLVFNNYDTSAWNGQLTTAAVFRDCSAWYHIVCSCDTDAATPIKIYVNNVQQTLTGTQPSAGSNTGFSYTATHRLGINYDAGNGLTNGFNGYFADPIFIDSQALTPSSFTEVSATTGQLIPKRYTGTFTGNSFWLPFSDNSSTTSGSNVGIGKDFSGLGNYWNTTNLSVTAGAGNDSLVDTPTSYGTDASAGGEVRGNYCTLNPLDKNANCTLSNGNLDFSTGTADYGLTRATFGMSTGKWYWEITPTSGAGSANFFACGIAKANASLAGFVGDTNSWGYLSGGNKYGNGAGGASYGAQYENNDVIGIAFDADNGTLTFYRNGTSQGQAFSGLTSGPYFPAVSDAGTAGGCSGVANFGQRPFAYQTAGTNRPAATYLALCDQNLAAPVVAKPSTVMDVKLYTGNGSTQTVSGLGFSPDLVWIKNRTLAVSHYWWDTVRGNTKSLKSNATDAEQTLTDFPSFNSDGFSVNNDNGILNTSSSAYAAWCFDGGTSTVSNTQGSITSSVRANASAGFSIVSYTGNGTAGATVGHGLGVSPGMVIIKNRSNISNWAVHHSSFSNSARDYLILEGTGGVAQTGTDWFAKSSTLLTFTNVYGGNNTSSNNYVGYCFAPVAGLSSFGSYTGNGSADGPFVYTGFRPRLVLFKCSSAVAYWGIYDAARNTYNAVNLGLYPNDSLAELSDQPFDFLSNGFKVRSSNAFVNSNGSTYVYAAFAENPFQYARAR